MTHLPSVRRVPILISVLIAAAALSYVSLSVVTSRGPGTAEAAGDDTDQVQRFDSLVDASSVIGVPLVEFDTSGTPLTFRGVSVHVPTAEHGGPSLAIAELLWNDPDGGWVRLLEGPGTGTLGNSKARVINGRTYDVMQSAPDDGRAFGILAIGWTSEGRQFILSMPFGDDADAALAAAARLAATVN
jgi:hypothetical protein